MSLPTDEKIQEFVKGVCSTFNNERSSLIPILQEVQKEYNYVPESSMQYIASLLGTSAADVNSVATFYHFIDTTPKGDVKIYLSEDMPAKMKGVDDVAAALEEEFGIKFGETTADGKVSLLWTSCIGMSDMSPAALVNDQVIPSLTPAKAKELAAKIKAGEKIEGAVPESSTNELTYASIEDNSGLKAALAKDPQEIIELVTDSGLRGLGGAGFLTGLKLKFCAAAEGDEKFVVCNADEGEPGTFKDRVIFTEHVNKVLEGMTISAYTVGANAGVIYLRIEYAYLKPLIEKAVQDRRDNNLLGENILGKAGFNFDIRVHMGAGAYVCGEETALIESIEGNRGEPRVRPPFPVVSGLFNKPTAVNNVETFGWLACILSKGSDWFKALGTEKSKGYKLLSISGDCEKPGVYEIEWGMTIADMLKMVGAADAKAVQVGGYSGELVPSAEFGRKIAYEDVATGGSIIIYGLNRNIAEITKNYLEFFIEEGCGQCTPCKEGNQVLLRGIEDLEESGSVEDLETLLDLCQTMKLASKCGLGQTSPNVVIAAAEHFRNEIVG